jgi:hypothetical protein
VVAVLCVWRAARAAVPGSWRRLELTDSARGEGAGGVVGVLGIGSVDGDHSRSAMS